ncbi:response regulator transcription factor [Amycolatopsis azurea]|uniref:response regulator transcription factor n=1 Tax=Amycolatopsis azurea TaxID=36819 RepID=UPI0038229D20
MTETQILDYALVHHTATTSARRTSPSPDAATLLSPRELQVAHLVRLGLTNQQIAKNLSIALRTAQTHVTHIMNKLDFRTRTQIAVWATEQERVAHQT